jgi:hypothetical protein
MRFAVGLVILVGAAGIGWWLFESRQQPEGVGISSVAVPTKPPENTLVDPLAPGRTVRLDTSSRAAGGADWVKARPAFQYSRTAKERDGVSPCAIPSDDGGAFEAWSNLSRGRLAVPRTGALDATGGFDLVLHFQGDELARREIAASGQSLVLYSLTLGPGESYPSLFAGTKLFGQLVQQIEQRLGAKLGREAHARHVALTAWSAGYMAVLSILVQPEPSDIDAVVLIDGLHGPRGALERQLAPFVDYARRAVSGERFMLLTHSSIDPPGFASTTESVHHVLAALGERPQSVRREDRFGLELVEYFTRGEFHVRGYTGNEKADHCAQVTLLRDAYSALARRWKR